MDIALHNLSNRELNFEVDKLIPKHRTSHMSYFEREYNYLPNKYLFYRSMQKMGLQTFKATLNISGLIMLTMITSRLTNTARSRAHYLGDVNILGTEEGSGSESLLKWGAISYFVLPRIQSSLSEIVKVHRPSRVDDLENAYTEYLTNKRSITDQMDVERRQSFNFLVGELNQTFRDSKEMSFEQSKPVVDMMYTLEVFVNSFESSLHVPDNIWHYDLPGVAATKLGEKMDRKIDAIKLNVDHDGQLKVEKFMKNHRKKTRPGWKPAPPAAGRSDLNVLVLTGLTGSGKTYLSKLICTQLGCPRIEMMFSDLLEHLGGPETSEANKGPVSTEGGSSLVNKFGTATKILYVRPGSIIAMEEVNLVGGTGKSEGLSRSAGSSPDTNKDYLDKIKRKWEPAGFGFFKLKAHSENVVFAVDLRRVSFIMTTNDPPADDALNRRFLVAQCNDMSEEARREVAAKTKADCANDSLPAAYRMLTPDLCKKIDGTMDKFMELVIKEGMSDPGPEPMQGVIISMMETMATETVSLKAEIPASRASEANRLVVEYLDSIDPLTNEKYRALIYSLYKEKRGDDVVKNMLDDAAVKIMEKDPDARIADFEFYEEYARKHKFATPKQSALFLINGIVKQWENEFSKRPDDMQKALNILVKKANQSMAAISKFGGNDKEYAAHGMHSVHSPSVDDCMKSYDILMRIPANYKNIAHWEVGGNKELREETKMRIKRVKERFEGSDTNGKSLEEFMNSLVFQSMTSGKDVSVTSSKRSILSLTGPLETSPASHAKRIFTDLGLDPTVMNISEYLNFLRLNASGFQADRKSKEKDELSFDIETMLGRLRPLLRGRDNQLSCGIVVTMTKALTPSQIDTLITAFSPDAPNPVLQLPNIPSVRFELPFNKIPIILTGEKIVDDSNFKMLVSGVHIEKVKEAERREELQKLMGDLAAFISLIDFQGAQKQKILDVLKKLLPYSLKKSMDVDAGAAPLISVFREVGFQLIRNEMDLAMASVPASRTATNGGLARPTERDVASQRSASPRRGSHASLSGQVDSQVDWAMQLATDDVENDAYSAEVLKRIEAGLDKYRNSARKTVMPSLPVNDVSSSETDLSDSDSDSDQSDSSAPNVRNTTKKPGTSLPKKTQAKKIDFPASYPLVDSLRYLAGIEGILQNKSACQKIEETIGSICRDAELEQLEPAALALFLHTIMDDVASIKKILKNNDGDLGAVNRNQQSLLHQAVLSNSTSVFNYLIHMPAARVALNQKDKQGQTLLHAVVLSGDMSMLESLVYINALTPLDFNLTDGQGNTPLALATKNARWEMMSLLMKIYLVDPSIRNASNETAYHLALTGGNVAALEGLLKAKLPAPELREELSALAKTRDLGDVFDALVPELASV